MRARIRARTRAHTYYLHMCGGFVMLAAMVFAGMPSGNGWPTAIPHGNGRSGGR